MFQSPTLDATDGYVEVETYKPFPRQRAFHSSPAKYRLFGGAAGPGKSRAILEEAHTQAIEGLSLSGVFAGSRAGCELISS